MDIERSVFSYRQIDFPRLLEFGFTRDGDSYVYETSINSDDFLLRISIDQHQVVYGVVYDKETGEPYVPFRREGRHTSFVAALREEYAAILGRIAEECSTPLPLLNKEMQEVADLIREEFGVEPDYPFEQNPYESTPVFRVKGSSKWFALMMSVKASRLGLEGDRLHSILDLKGDPKAIPFLLERDGYLPAYHMNKQHWYTIILDGSIGTEEMRQRLQEAYQITASKKK